MSKIFGGWGGVPETPLNPLNTALCICISYPLLFCIPAEGVPLKLGTGAGGQKTRMMGLPGRERSLTISSAVWIEGTNVTDRKTDRRTDRRTLGHSKYRAYA